MLGILISILAFFLLLITYLLFNFIVSPLIKLRKYKKAGHPTYFFPLLGIFKRHVNDLLQREDWHLSCKEFYTTHPNKKIIATNMGSDLCLYICDPEYIKEAVQKQQYYKKTKFNDVLAVVVGQGLITTEGNEWKRNRKVVSAFFNFEFIKNMIPLVQETTKAFLDKVEPSSMNDYKILKRMQDITGEAVGRSFFGKSLEDVKFKDQTLTESFGGLIKHLGVLLKDPFVIFFGPKALNLPFKKFKKAVEESNEFRAMILGFIKARKQQQTKQEEKDLLSLLLTTQNSNDPETYFSDEQIVNEYVTFVGAGMETTAILIAGIFYQLYKNPQYIEKLREERARIYDAEEVVTIDTLNKMDLLNSVVKETLRLYAPAPDVMLREAAEDHKLMDLDIKKGTLININIFPNQYNEEYFKDAFTFYPERWMNPDNKVPSYVFMPFSAGARNCIGQHLATVEAKVVVSEFLKRFDYKVKDGYKMVMGQKLLYEPVDELVFELKHI